MSATGTAAVVKVFDNTANTSAHDDSLKILSRTSESESEVGFLYAIVNEKGSFETLLHVYRPKAID